MKVAGYVRVSTEEQALMGVSLAAQREKLVGYAKLYELVMTEVVEDAGASGKSLEREGLQRCLKLLDQGKVEGILIAKLDRLTRSVADMAWLVQRYFSEKAGKRLVSVGDHLDTKTAAGRLVLNVLVSVSQWEREAIGERTSTALQHKKMKGQVYGEVPLGYVRRKDKLVVVPEEMKVIALVRTLHEEGKTLAEVAAALTAAGAKTKKGGRWHPVTVRKILARRRLTILRGLPGSGKSTYAKRWLNASIHSTDDFWWKGTTWSFNGKWLAEAHAWNLRAAEKAMNEKRQHVIIDNTNVKREHYEKYIEAGKKNGYEIEAVVFDTPVALCLHRCIHNVPSATVQKMRFGWEHDRTLLTRVIGSGGGFTPPSDEELAALKSESKAALEAVG